MTKKCQIKKKKKMPAPQQSCLFFFFLCFFKGGRGSCGTFMPVTNSVVLC